MGRPPVGKTAMSAAERMRRYRARHAVTKPVTERKPAATTFLQRENERLRAENAALKQENSALKQQAAEEAIVRSALQESRGDHAAALDKALRRLRRRESTRNRKG